MTGQILIKIHKSHRIVVAVCDKDIHDRIFNEEDKCLDLTTQFFNGETMNKEETKRTLISYAREDATFNIVGKDSVGIAKKIGIIKDDGIIKIADIPFALVLL